MICFRKTDRIHQRWDSPEVVGSKERTRVIKYIPEGLRNSDESFKLQRRKRNVLARDLINDSVMSRKMRLLHRGLV